MLYEKSIEIFLPHSRSEINKFIVKIEINHFEIESFMIFIDIITNLQHIFITIIFLFCNVQKTKIGEWFYDFNNDWPIQFSGVIVKMANVIASLSRGHILKQMLGNKKSFLNYEMQKSSFLIN